jgi:hypothetical protein
MTSFGMAGIFPNRINENDIIIDPTIETPSDNTQEELRSEVQDFEDIMALDYRYCIMVEGVAQESNLWVPRNQNETGLADTDLQRFKNVTWNECVVRKFLTTEKGDVSTVGRSMISIIQALNLQWKNLQVMGVHPKIEAAEKQVIMRCFEENLFDFTLQLGMVSRAFRRCQHFSDFFANAVGGYVCHNTGRTPGLSKTMYGSDIDFAYREKNYMFLVNALRKKKDIIQKCIQHADSVDYISRLTQLKIIKSISPNVDLQDYDMGKPQQPMYVTSQGGSPGIDIRDIIQLLESKIPKSLDKPYNPKEFESLKRDIADMADTVNGFKDSLIKSEQNALGIIKNIDVTLENFNKLDLGTIVFCEMQARDELYQILHHIHEIIRQLLESQDGSGLARVPPEPVRQPIPQRVQDFIRRQRPVMMQVANEALLSEPVTFERLTRQRTTVAPVTQPHIVLDGV